MNARVIINKRERRLSVCEDGVEVFSCPVSLGCSPEGDKRAEGDGRTPEGVYRVVTRNSASKYHLSLGLSYPGVEDAKAALREGRIGRVRCHQILSAHSRGARPPWDTPLGGYIMIHGGGTDGDWTMGCVAVSDADIDALWELCPMGTEVEIRP